MTRGSTNTLEIDYAIVQYMQVRIPIHTMGVNPKMPINASEKSSQL